MGDPTKQKIDESIKIINAALEGAKITYGPDGQPVGAQISPNLNGQDPRKVVEAIKYLREQKAINEKNSDTQTRIRELLQVAEEKATALNVLVDAPKVIYDLNEDIAKNLQDTPGDYNSRIALSAKRNSLIKKAVDNINALGPDGLSALSPEEFKEILTMMKGPINERKTSQEARLSEDSKKFESPPTAGDKAVAAIYTKEIEAIYKAERAIQDERLSRATKALNPLSEKLGTTDITSIVEKFADPKNKDKLATLNPKERATVLEAVESLKDVIQRDVDAADRGIPVGNEEDKALVAKANEVIENVKASTPATTQKSSSLDSIDPKAIAQAFGPLGTLVVGIANSFTNSAGPESPMQTTMPATSGPTSKGR